MGKEVEGEDGGGRLGVLVVEGPSAVILAPSCPSLGNTWREVAGNLCLLLRAPPAARTKLALKSDALIRSIYLHQSCTKRYQGCTRALIFIFVPGLANHYLALPVGVSVRQSYSFHVELVDL